MSQETTFTPEQLLAEANRHGGLVADMLTYAATLRQAARVDDDALLEIARDCGIRRHLHGVDATKAKRLLREFVTALEAALSAQPAPIPMVLHCPSCHIQHIDAPDERTPEWDNPPHRSHLCHGCGTIWRPADVPTVGVAAIQTRGKADVMKPAQPAERQGEAVACIDHRHLQLLRKDWRQGNCLKHPDDAVAGDVMLYTNPAAPVGVPDGWKLVPIEATDDMLRAAYPLHWWDGPGQRLKQDYRKLVDAAPSAPQGVDRG